MQLDPDYVQVYVPKALSSCDLARQSREMYGRDVYLAMASEARHGTAREQGCCLVGERRHARPGLGSEISGAEAWLVFPPGSGHLLFLGIRHLTTPRHIHVLHVSSEDGGEKTSPEQEGPEISISSSGQWLLMTRVWFLTRKRDFQ